jgi:hypothetical protein
LEIDFFAASPVKTRSFSWFSILGRLHRSLCEVIASTQPVARQKHAVWMRTLCRTADLQAPHRKIHSLQRGEEPVQTFGGAVERLGRFDFEAEPPAFGLCLARAARMASR